MLPTGISIQTVVDEFGHCVLPGERFIKALYLENQCESRKAVSYKMSKTGVAYVHFAEVFATHIAMSDNVSMDIKEYQGICEELLNFYMTWYFYFVQYYHSHKKGMEALAVFYYLHPRG